MEKEKHIDLSVIVPIYNTETYLPVCLDSLLGIDGPCVEIVLVNDGSTDGSGMIADAYAQKDSRIRVIHRANGGASAARNTGLEVARGEYILFVDSDDWVLSDALVSLFHAGGCRDGRNPVLRSRGESGGTFQSGQGDAAGSLAG